VFLRNVGFIINPQGAISQNTEFFKMLINLDLKMGPPLRSSGQRGPGSIPGATRFSQK
jgi:hypothetical protein